MKSIWITHDIGHFNKTLLRVDNYYTLKNKLEDSWLHLILLEDFLTSPHRRRTWNLHLMLVWRTSCHGWPSQAERVLYCSFWDEGCAATKGCLAWWFCPNTCGNWRLSYIWHVYPTYLRIYINSLNDDDESLLCVTIHAWLSCIH